jgi:hypothetical protein
MMLDTSKAPKKVNACTEHSKVGFRIPQMAWRVAEEAKHRSGVGQMPFSGLNGQVHAHVQGCRRQHRK